MPVKAENGTGSKGNKRTPQAKRSPDKGKSGETYHEHLFSHFRGINIYYRIPPNKDMTN